MDYAISVSMFNTVSILEVHDILMSTSTTAVSKVIQSGVDSLFGSGAYAVAVTSFATPSLVSAGTSTTIASKLTAPVIVVVQDDGNSLIFLATAISCLSCILCSISLAVIAVRKQVRSFLMPKHEESTDAIFIDQPGSIGSCDISADGEDRICIEIADCCTPDEPYKRDGPEVEIVAVAEPLLEDTVLAPGPLQSEDGNRQVAKTGCPLLPVGSLNPQNAAVDSDIDDASTVRISSYLESLVDGCEAHQYVSDDTDSGGYQFTGIAVRFSFDAVPEAVPISGSGSLTSRTEDATGSFVDVFSDVGDPKDASANGHHKREVTNRRLGLEVGAAPALDDSGDCSWLPTPSARAKSRRVRRLRSSREGPMTPAPLLYVTALD